MLTYRVSYFATDRDREREREREREKGSGEKERVREGGRVEEGERGLLQYVIGLSQKSREQIRKTQKKMKWGKELRVLLIEVI